MAERWIIRVDKKGRRRPERITIPDRQRTTHSEEQEHRTSPTTPETPQTPHRDRTTGFAEGFAAWA